MEGVGDSKCLVFGSSARRFEAQDEVAGLPDVQHLRRQGARRAVNNEVYADGPAVDCELLPGPIGQGNGASSRGLTNLYASEVQRRWQQRDERRWRWRGCWGCGWSRCRGGRRCGSGRSSRWSWRRRSGTSRSRGAGRRRCPAGGWRRRSSRRCCPGRSWRGCVSRRCRCGRRRRPGRGRCRARSRGRRRVWRGRISRSRSWRRARRGSPAGSCGWRRGHARRRSRCGRRRRGR